jgi:enoyl-[acyl-carrier protein] reductase I
MPDRLEMRMDFLGLHDAAVLVAGVANKRSVAARTARLLLGAGATVLFSVRDEPEAAQVRKLFGDDAQVWLCDVERQEQIDALAAGIADRGIRLDGFVHSLAFAAYERDTPFHATSRAAFLQAVDISCFSLIAMCNALKPVLGAEASVVTIGISTTRMAAANYGFMAPVKAALASSVVFLAKSFSEFSRVRFNAVCPSLLKTSASAGIPDYLDSYLYAEQATLRKEAVTTDEVANTVAFLLSRRSSGITAQSLVIDAGMGVNYFDSGIVNAVTRRQADPPG